MSLIPRPLLIAHRGAARELPENTLPAFTRALELGADVIETDAHLSADGHVVIAHDPNGRRMAGVARAIAETPLADLKTWDVGRRHRMPTLEEVLVELAGVPINLDVKQHTPRMVEATLEVIRKLKAQDRVTLASFDARTLQSIRRAGYEGRTSLAMREVIEMLGMPGALWRRLPMRGQIAQLPPRAGPLVLGSRAIIDRIHALGLPVDFWTIDDPAEARRLLDLGADGIMTNDPGLIGPVFSAWR